jgi:hypothetical protein
LVSCGQSYHWFNIKKFTKEVKRVSRANSVIAIWGYFLPRINNFNDRILDDFYCNLIYDYWEKESRDLETAYEDIYFPFDDVKYKMFEIKESWSKSHYFAYLSTWSFLKKFLQKNNYNPLADLFKKLELPERFNVRFPVFCKIGKISK